jgi:hypothetical protein
MSILSKPYEIDFGPSEEYNHDLCEFVGNHKPKIQEVTVFRNAFPITPSWEAFVKYKNEKSNSLNPGATTVRLLGSNGFCNILSNNLEEHIEFFPESRPYWNTVQKALWCCFLPDIYTLISTNSSGLSGSARHRDHNDAIHWNCIGSSFWQIYGEDGSVKYEILYPGDVLYIPFPLEHEVTSMTQKRACILMSNVFHHVGG